MMSGKHKSQWRTPVCVAIEPYAHPTVRVVIGPHIRKHRQQQGMSQERLAELAEMSTRNLIEIERYGRMPSAGVLYRVARALAVPVDTLITEAR